MDIKTTELGGKYYEQLPEGTRIASIDDFYDHRGNLAIGKAFLVNSMINPDRYWANRIKACFTYREADFLLFMESGLVFVFEKG